MQVLKFGGTSVANAENIKQVIKIVKSALEKDSCVLVLSAMGGVTDQLLRAAELAAAGNESYKDELKNMEIRHLEAAKQLLPVTQQSQALSLIKSNCNQVDDICNGIFLLQELTPRIKDRISSYGELLSSQLIAACFHAYGTENTWKDARELIRTDSNFTAAVVDFEATGKQVTDYFSMTPARLYVLPGFVASDSNGSTTTLGRGGSDFTASVLAAAINASVLEIWTDVSGMMTADPRLTANARIIPSISYQEAMELSHFGAKVIYPPTIQPVMSKKIPVWIKNTFIPEDPGTVIESSAAHNGNIVRGISSINKIALLSLEGSGMVGIPGFSKRLFEALSKEKINVILITQSSSEHTICVGIDEAFVEKASLAVNIEFANEIVLQKVEQLKTETGLSIIALVGDKMKSHPGISGRMFSAMGRNGVNVRAIAQGSSEKNISAVIGNRDVRKAVNVLHEEFFETTFKLINLFVIGTGNVGKRLMAQIQQQLGFLHKQMQLLVHVAGISNSRTMVVNESGIDIGDWETILANGDKAGLQGFVNEIITRNLRNSVFVDITASDEVSSVYEQLLKKSISVVACNKVAASSEYDNYKKLKDLAREYNCRFLFETNVGAGLPVIGTLNDLMTSGDTVRRIEAVLSGTLNFVFNNYDGSRKFADVVKQAQDEGYTEPDPRLDLGGTDVMRKIMILAREAGARLEMSEISNESFMPASCMAGSVDDFYTAMTKEEEHFRKIFQKAEQAGCKLKFVATYESADAGPAAGGKAAVGLKHISPKDDLYHLYGKDNVVLFYTDRYREQPLVIKGAGAGADVTASGVFADILRAVKI